MCLTFLFLDWYWWRIKNWIHLSCCFLRYVFQNPVIFWWHNKQKVSSILIHKKQSKELKICPKKDCSKTKCRKTVLLSYFALIHESLQGSRMFCAMWQTQYRKMLILFFFMETARSSWWDILMVIRAFAGLNKLIKSTTCDLP